MKRLVLPAAMSALALVSGCSSGGADTSATEAATSVISGAAMAQESPGLSSEVKALAFDAVPVLPRAPTGSETQPSCPYIVTEPKSAEAREVASAGWGVTGEARLGKYQVVSFAGSFEESTSGSCFVSKGNVAVFENGKLRAIAYARSGGRETIGHIEPFGKNALRIWDGDIVPTPIADLNLDGGGLKIAKLAGEERTCGGVVPAINGLPITQARAKLIAARWSPVNHGSPDDRIDEREKALAERGVIEVDSCSGTGFGYCSFDYQRPGAKLGVVTVGDGEDPTVERYGVDCDH